ncbi:hypothetical protein VMCG_03435 [Cytospora schulzeri]|uniref:Clr5 domain-containing protein n=1 Tax=Cytospora schulzeri TaxID=448051 RepID=A0A423WW98_9PEZI|nr:hypothetical protein VMCG_03435 [Valsa malicola]
MSPAKRTLPDDKEDIWDRHKETLKKLYVTNRKKLEDVKRSMETEHGFPEVPLSTYEAKLRDKLHLRKKLKKTDWPVIYQHHLRRGGKKSAIYLNGSLIPWRKVWKEIRRSGVHLAERDLLSPGALPADVTIRTPPSTPPPTGSSSAPVAVPGLEIDTHTSLTPVSGGLQMPMFPTLHSLFDSFNTTSNCASTRTFIESSLAESSNQELTGSVLKRCLTTIPLRQFLSMWDREWLKHTTSDTSPGPFHAANSLPRAHDPEFGLDFDTYNLLARLIGADVKDSVSHISEAQEYPVRAAAIVFIYNDDKNLVEKLHRAIWSVVSPEMLPDLNGQVVKTEFSPFEMNAFNFLRRHPLPTINCQNTLLQRRFQDFLDTGVGLGDVTSSEADLWLPFISLRSDQDKTYRLALCELLFRQGAPVRPGSPLTALILLDGSHSLILDVIEAGADINKVSNDICWGGLTPLQAACGKGDLMLARDLLQRGAGINAPAVGRYDRTALQYACEWSPSSMEEEQTKTKLIRFLIGHGADVNAEPAPYFGGFTALHIAARNGDLETAFILLEHGADVNSRDRKDGYCALDGAAMEGRLDMVKFLLNANALSDKQGSTGYDGAIRAAETEGHFAVADLIREHAAENSRWGITNPHFVPRPGQQGSNGE